MRSNQANDGKDFEAEIKLCAAEYQFRGWLRLKKVDPPVRTLGGGEFRRVIFLQNPWLDFSGCWTERGGRALFIECKSTAEDKLSIGHKGGSGVTPDQISSMINWRLAGAVAFALWRCPSGVALLSARFLSDVVRRATAGNGTRTLHWADARVRVAPGANPAKVPWDFLPVMREHL